MRWFAFSWCFILLLWSLQLFYHREAFLSSRPCTFYLVFSSYSDSNYISDFSTILLLSILPYAIIEFLTPNLCFDLPSDFFSFLLVNSSSCKWLLEDVWVYMDAGYIFNIIFHLSLVLPLIFCSPFVRKLEHRSHFSSFSSLWTPPLFTISCYIPLYVLPNRPHSPPSFVFIVASSLT